MSLRIFLPTLTTWLLVFFAGTVSAQVVEAQVEIKGMSCPFCVTGVNKHLSAIDGVNQVTVDLEKSQAVLAAAEGESISAKAVASAIYKAGFTPGSVDIVALGVLERRESSVTLRLPGDREPLPLKVPDNLVPKIQDLADTSIGVEIKGSYHFTIEEGRWLEVASVAKVAQ